jgi:[acyl-carrier-protein] S-malonyltransferase
MRPAQERLARDLEQVAFCDARVPLVNNVEARVVSGAAECRDGLVRQVSAPVLWSQCVERLAGEGAVDFVELGPGSVLCGLIRKIAVDARVLNVEDVASLDATAAALRGEG